jgi:prolyl oligopeptidase PreP (S9A serine peptidase family)
MYVPQDYMIRKCSTGSLQNGYKLRTKKNDTVLYLDTNMDAGHGGASGRFEALKELAKEFTFIDLESITK